MEVNNVQISAQSVASFDKQAKEYEWCKDSSASLGDGCVDYNYVKYREDFAQKLVIPWGARKLVRKTFKQTDLKNTWKIVDMLKNTDVI